MHNTFLMNLLFLEQKLFSSKNGFMSSNYDSLIDALIILCLAIGIVLFGLNSIIVNYELSYFISHCSYRHEDIKIR